MLSDDQKTELFFRLTRALSKLSDEELAIATLNSLNNQEIQELNDVLYVKLILIYNQSIDEITNNVDENELPYISNIVFANTNKNEFNFLSTDILDFLKEYNTQFNEISNIIH